MNIDERVFEKLGDFPKWTEDDGPAPYVFADRPAGHRCAWSCHWASNNPRADAPHIVTPADWGFQDPGKMLPSQIEAEFEDLIFQRLLESQPFGGAGIENMLAVSLDLKAKVMHQNETIFQMLRAFREGFNRNRSYTNPWNEPTRGMVRRNNRPGWIKE